jgi:hypothetical protein
MAVTILPGILADGSVSPSTTASTIKSNLGIIPASVEEIKVTGTGDQTTVVQGLIDGAGTDIHLVFDTPEVELFGLVIEDKSFVKMSTTSKTIIYFPTGGTYDCLGTGTQTGYDRGDPVMQFTNCDHVEISGPFEINGSRALGWNVPTADVLLQYAIRIEGTSKRLVHVENVDFRDIRVHGILVNYGGTYGYEFVNVRNCRGYNLPHGLVKVNGQHDQIILQNLYSEDPNAYAVFNINSNVQAISITGNVEAVVNGDKRIKQAIIQDSMARYSNATIRIQQGCDFSLMKNIVVQDRGFDSDGNDTGHVGGPSIKTDNVWWRGKAFDVVENYQMLNTNPDTRFLSAWIGQAGDQSIKFVGCDFDSKVVIHGDGTRNVAAGEGHSRFGIAEDCTFRDVVTVKPGKGAILKGCRFLPRTITLDPSPVDGKERQHDDILESVPYETWGLLVNTTSESDIEELTLHDCDFVGKGLRLSGNVNVYGQDCRFTYNGQVEPAFDYRGHSVFTNPIDLYIEAGNITIDSGATPAGTIDVVSPIGSFTGTISDQGQSGPCRVRRFDAVHSETLTDDFTFSANYVPAYEPLKANKIWSDNGTLKRTQSSILFDGTQRIEYDTSENPLLGSPDYGEDWSVECDLIAEINDDVFLSWGNSANTSAYIYLEVDSNGTFRCLIYGDDGANKANLTSSTFIADGKQHRIKFEVVNNIARVWIDGVLDSRSDTVDSYTLTTNRLNIGALGRSSDTNYYSGQLFNLRVTIDGTVRLDMPFDDAGGGTVTDYSGNGFDGSVINFDSTMWQVVQEPVPEPTTYNVHEPTTGNVIWAQQGTLKRSTNVLEFDGTNKAILYDTSVSTTLAAPTFAEDWSFECEFIAPPPPDGDTFISWGSSALDTAYIYFELDPFGRVRLRIVDDAGATAIDTQTIARLTENYQYHVKLEVISGEVTIYLNGREAPLNTTTISSYTLTSNQFAIAALNRTSTISYFEGKLWNLKLTIDGTVRLLMPFDEGFGDSVADYSGNNNSGTITNFESSMWQVVSDPQIKTGLKTIQDVTADVSVATDVDLLNCDCTSGAITVTLPRAIKGHTISIRKTDSSANTLTIDGFSIDTINGASTNVLSTQYDSLTLVFDGTSEWAII